MKYIICNKNLYMENETIPCFVIHHIYKVIQDKDKIRIGPLMLVRDAQNELHTLGSLYVFFKEYSLIKLFKKL